MADYPSLIYVREPVLAGVTDLEAALFTDINNEVVAIETELGASGSATGRPKGNFASLAARLDALLSEGGNMRRKLSTWQHWDGTTDGVKGVINQRILCGITGTFNAGGGPYDSTISFGQTYLTTPTQIYVMPYTTQAAGTFHGALCYVKNASVTTTGFNVIVGEVTGAGDNTLNGLSAGNNVIVMWCAVGGDI